jgi:hypothetical protein
VHLSKYRHVNGLPVKLGVLAITAVGATAMGTSSADASSDVSAQSSMYCGTGGGYRDCLSLWNSESDPKYYSATVCNRNKSSYLLNPKLVIKNAVSGGWHRSMTQTLKPGKCMTLTHAYSRHYKICTAFYTSGSAFALIAVCHKW